MPCAQLTHTNSKAVLPGFVTMPARRLETDPQASTPLDSFSLQQYYAMNKYLWDTIGTAASNSLSALETAINAK